MEEDMSGGGKPYGRGKYCPGGKTMGGYLSGVAQMTGGDVREGICPYTDSNTYTHFHTLCGGYNDIFAAIDLYK